MHTLYNIGNKYTEPMQVAILKYNAGNIRSVVSALERIGCSPIVTDSAETLTGADKVVIPGQGAAGATMAYLKAHGLDRVIRSLRQPVLGICIGQQLMCRHSDEGDTDCLGIFPTDVKRFVPTSAADKIPAMGWNELHNMRTPLFDGISEGDFVYFVHSYYVPLCQYTIATAHYTLPFSAAIQRDNFYATQFHPEKSGSVGEKLLANFIDL